MKENLQTILYFINRKEVQTTLCWKEINKKKEMENFQTSNQLWVNHCLVFHNIVYMRWPIWKNTFICTKFSCWLAKYRVYICYCVKPYKTTQWKRYVYIPVIAANQMSTQTCRSCNLYRYLVLVDTNKTISSEECTLV